MEGYVEHYNNVRLNSAVSSQFKSAAVLGHVLFNREMCCLAFDRCVIRRLSQEFML